MNTVRITLPNNVIVDADFESALSIIKGLTLTPVLEEPKKVKQVKVSKPIIASKIVTEIKQLKTKIEKDVVVPNISNYNPVRSLTTTQRKILAAAFHYAPDKNNSKGRAAYIAAILMDFQIHTVYELIALSSANISTVSFTLTRLREIGSQIDTTSDRLASKTLVQLNVLVNPKSKITSDKAHTPKQKIMSQASTSDGFNNLTV